MSRKKLFATDYDWTLTEYPDGVTDYSIEMIDKFRSEGNIFGIITGRSVYNVGDIKERMKGHLDFLMCMTGALAQDGDYNFMFDCKGDGTVLPEILRAIAESGATYLSWADVDKAYFVDVKDALDDNGEAMTEARRHKTFSQINTSYETYEEAAVQTEALLKRFGDKINPQINGSCVDIPPYGVSKGTAVLRMAEHFGVDPDCIFTAGDNINDISMIEMHYGFSVPHGKDGAKAAAKEILPNVGEMLKRAMELK